MTLNLELPPETEACLREIARVRNLAVEEATAQALEQWMQQQSAVADEEAKARRRAAIKKAGGCMKDTELSSDDFLRRRHEEAQRELEKDETRWREREARGASDISVLDSSAMISLLTEEPEAAVVEALLVSAHEKGQGNVYAHTVNLIEVHSLFLCAFARWLPRTNRCSD